MKVTLPKAVVSVLEPREEPYMQWLPWFAWRPVLTVDYEVVWLRRVQRRYAGMDDRGGHYDYRIGIEGD